MQPPDDGSYPGPQNPQGPQDPNYPQYPQYPQGGDPNAGHPYQGGYGYPQNPPPQGYQGGYPPPGGYPPHGGYGYQPPPRRGITSRGSFWITLAAVVVIAAAIVSTLIVTSGRGDKTPVGAGSNSPTGSPSSSDSTSTSAPSPSDTTASAPTTSAGVTTSSAATSSAATSASGTPLTSGGTIGQTYDAPGILDGEKVAVTLLAVDQDARATNSYEQPDAGQHYVATEYRVRNVGTVKYDDALNNCVEVYDKQDDKYNITYASDISSGTVIDDVTLQPGQSATGWLVYSVPVGTSIAKTSFQPDSAIAKTILRWTVG